MVSRDEVVDGFRTGVRRAMEFFRGELRTTQAYRGMFIANGQLTRDGEVVLHDLMRFARETHDVPLFTKTATGAVDPYMAGVIEGRRQVVARIGRALWMPEHEFAAMKQGAYDERSYSDEY